MRGILLGATKSYFIQSIFVSFALFSTLAKSEFKSEPELVNEAQTHLEAGDNEKAFETFNNLRSDNYKSFVVIRMFELGANEIAFAAANDIEDNRRHIDIVANLFADNKDDLGKRFYEQVKKSERRPVRNYFIPGVVERLFFEDRADIALSLLDDIDSEHALGDLIEDRVTYRDIENAKKIAARVKTPYQLQESAKFLIANPSPKVKELGLSLAARIDDPYYAIMVAEEGLKSKQPELASKILDKISDEEKLDYARRHYINGESDEHGIAKFAAEQIKDPEIRGILVTNLLNLGKYRKAYEVIMGFKDKKLQQEWARQMVGSVIENRHFLNNQAEAFKAAQRISCQILIQSLGT